VVDSVAQLVSKVVVCMEVWFNKRVEN